MALKVVKSAEVIERKKQKFKEWYEANKDIVAEKKKERYAYDTEYREKIKARSLLARRLEREEKKREKELEASKIDKSDKLE